MFLIRRVAWLAPGVRRIEVEAPRVTTNHRPGHFVIVRVREQGERIPLTVADSDPQAGTITLARATGLPLLPVASAARWCRRVSSWDRFEIPLPGSEAAIVFGEPILVGADATAEERGEQQVRLESVLNVLTNRARAAVGLPPEPPELSG